MPTIRTEAAAVIDAPPSTVYSILSDYHHSHPEILPKKIFVHHEVERGGTGAGTIIRFQMRTMGITRSFRAEITEPEPGRTLLETNLGPRRERTTFTVDPVDGGQRSRVTIATEWESKGIQAWIDRRFAPPLLQQIFAEQLKNLARVAAERASK